MARPELGTKRVCPTTGRKFYDLNKDPIVSPYTGEVIQRAVAEPARATASRASRVVEEEDEPAAPVADAETISLEDAAAEEETAAEGEDEATVAEDGAADDTFLEEEEEGGDVADLIDGDIEDDEEA